MARILVIDDDPQVRTMLRQMLERIGHEVSEAPDGAAGLAAFAESPIDLVITDICMPGQAEGIATIRRLVETSPYVQIIALSGGAGPSRVSDPADRLAAAKSSGAARTLRKPVDMQELTETVLELLGEKA